MQSDKIIICGGGASIPFDSERFKSEGQGLAPLLQKTIENNYSIGLNSWFRFGCPVTVDFVNDFVFYRGNHNKLKELPLVIARYNAQLYTFSQYAPHENTLVLPDAKYYFGMDSWDIHNKKCLVCDFKVNKSDHIKFCPTHKSKLMPIGFYHGHLAGMISTSIAIALGFKEIYLLGMDCCETNGKTHFYQDLVTNFKEFFGVGKVETKNGGSTYRTSAYTDPVKLNNKYYSVFNEHNDAKIYNVSPNSKIEAFEKIDYTTFYEQLANSSVNQVEARKEIREYILEKTK